MLEYITKVLGIPVTYLHDEVKHLPNYIRSRYEVRYVLFDEFKVFLMYPREEIPQASVLKKHMAKLQQIEAIPVVLILENLPYRQKEYLLKEHIPFVVDGKQIYLPFMGIYLQEKGDAVLPWQEKMLPSAQLLLLHFIYSGSGSMYTSQAAQDLGLTSTSISRASRQLVQMNLVKAEIDGVQKRIFSDDAPNALFERARKNLLSPVKRIVYVAKTDIQEEMLMSGYSALSEYSMLNPPDVETFATKSISCWNGKCTEKLLDAKSQEAIEYWRYDPKILSRKNCVDPLSLALSFQNDPDERAEEAVDSMLENLWRKINGKGH